MPFAEGEYKCGFYFESNQYVYLPVYVQRGKTIDIKIEKESLKVSKVTFVLKNSGLLEASVKETLNKNNKLHEIMKEDTLFDISEFIAFLQLANAGETKDDDKNVGANIWSELI